MIIFFHFQSRSIEYPLSIIYTPLSLSLLGIFINFLSTFLASLSLPPVQQLIAKMFISPKSLSTLLFLITSINAQASGSGTTTRYWDCCKPSCSWTKKLTLASGAHPVTTCDASDNPLADYDAKSGCDGGGAYMCTNQMPWAVSDTLSYGFAAASIAGGNEASWCCACYELTFTSGPVIGKKLIVQTTNTGGDLGSNHFDLAVIMATWTLGGREC